jgi:hypothetical protein
VSAARSVRGRRARAGEGETVAGEGETVAGSAVE